MNFTDKLHTHGHTISRQPDVMLTQKLPWWISLIMREESFQ